MIRLPFPSLLSLPRSGLLLLFSLSIATLSGQVSHGGHPLPISAGVGARSVGPASDLFVEMPSFDVQAALRNALHDRQNLKSLQFAHKFDVHLRPDNSGIRFTTAGMEVWRVGIRSRGAHSLNLLFSKFRLPEGAKLFVYNADQSEILGSYTSRNNSDLNLLPVQPIGGEELIVEYQVPYTLTDKGRREPRLRDTEGYRTRRSQAVVPSHLVVTRDIEPGSGGGLDHQRHLFCTGALVNNTQKTVPLPPDCHHTSTDNANNFNLNRRYDLIAGSVVAFLITSPGMR